MKDQGNRSAAKGNRSNKSEPERATDPPSAIDAPMRDLTLPSVDNRASIIIAQIAHAIAHPTSPDATAASFAALLGPKKCKEFLSLEYHSACEAKETSPDNHFATIVAVR